MRVLAQGGNIPDEKRERRSPSSEGFHSRLINWQITVNYRAGKLYKGYSIRLPLPLFFPGFSFALSVSVSPDSSASLYALHVAVDFSSRSSLSSFFFCQFLTSFARTRFSHFTPGLLLSTLGLHFLRVVFLFSLPLHVSISFSSSPSFCLLRRSTFSSFYARSPLFRRFPFFLTRRFFFLPNVTDALAFRTRSAGEGVVVRIITRTHPGYRRRLRRCVKLGNRFGTRNRAENAAPADCAARFHVAPAYRSHATHCQGTVVIIPGVFF